MFNVRRKISPMHSLSSPIVSMPCCPAPLPCYTLCWCTPLPYNCDIFRHFTTHLDAFRLFWHILRYIYVEQNGTEYGQLPYPFQIYVTGMMSKTVTSARINDVLRYVGITRNMNAYIILSQALTLIAKDEDRLRAMEKEVHTPIADKKLYEPKAVQSTIRRASKVA